MKHKTYAFVGIAAVGLAVGIGLPVLRAADIAAPPATFSDPMETCVNHYNNALKQAKASLKSGDRNGALKSLLEAQAQLKKCEEIEGNSSAHSVVGFNTDQATPPRVDAICS